MELQIPHNYFTLWMVTPSRALTGARPVDHLKGGPAPLLRAAATGWLIAAGVLIVGLVGALVYLMRRRNTAGNGA